MRYRRKACSYERDIHHTLCRLPQQNHQEPQEIAANLSMVCSEKRSCGKYTSPSIRPSVIEEQDEGLGISLQTFDHPVHKRHGRQRNGVFRVGEIQEVVIALRAQRTLRRRPSREL
jgi:hypothetical protein